MAFRTRKSYSTKKPKRKKRSSYTELERMAYNLGRVKRGLNNPNSRVFESYKNGCTGKTTKNRKPLI